jgi:hypothetical protein
LSLGRDPTIAETRIRSISEQMRRLTKSKCSLNIKYLSY